jgi:hypothetical protein
MAPFVVNHPMLLNAWMVARETAIARVRALPAASVAERARFEELVHRARAGLTEVAHAGRAPVAAGV